MKTIRVDFYVANVIEKEETVEVNVREDATEDELQETVKEFFEEWVWENVETTFTIQN